MKKVFAIALLGSVVSVGCTKEREKNCATTLAGSYTAVAEQNGVREETLQIRIATPVPYEANKIWIYEEGSDDAIHAEVLCDTKKIRFNKQAEIPELVKGEGSFTLAPNTLDFSLWTSEGGVTDQMRFILTQP